MGKNKLYDVHWHKTAQSQVYAENEEEARKLALAGKDDGFASSEDYDDPFDPNGGWYIAQIEEVEQGDDDEDEDDEEEDDEDDDV